MISEEVKNKNFEIFLKKLSQVGVDATMLAGNLGEKIKNASFTNINDFGNAYQGSLVEIVLKVLTPYAVRINELLPEGQRVDKNTLVKICLLHHIAKAVRLVPNDNQWEVEKRLMVYKYDDSQPSIRTGLHSLILAQSCGETFTPEEAEAMTVNDRDLTDDQARWHSSVMATIIRQANELTYIQINKKK
jgi:hypothetical protein